MPARRPVPSDLYRLEEQLEADRRMSLQALRERDHAVGRQCAQTDDERALLCWLQQVGGAQANARPDAAGAGSAHLLMVLRGLALVLGMSAMAGFLLASERALVNVPVFLLTFVLLQLALCVLAGWVVFRTSQGQPPPAFFLNPARLLLHKAWPQPRDAGGKLPALRLLLLRHGQEAGALFALGVMLAFLAVPALTDFSFVWGSTFAVSDQVVAAITRALAAPWAWFLPEATVAVDLIADTRFHAAQAGLGDITAASRRGWWPFLFMCLLTYTLLPRLLLWLWSLLAFRHHLRAELLSRPGVASVLSRMRAPLVETRAGDAELPTPTVPELQADAVLNWAGALDSLSEAAHAGLPAVLTVEAGLGTLDDDAKALAALNRAAPRTLLVAVRGWEPPLADLADVLAQLPTVEHCRLLLAPLPSRATGAAQVTDWQAFGRKLPFARTDVEVWPGGRPEPEGPAT